MITSMPKQIPGLIFSSAVGVFSFVELYYDKLALDLSVSCSLSMFCPVLYMEEAPALCLPQVYLHVPILSRAASLAYYCSLARKALEAVEVIPKDIRRKWTFSFRS